jgi:hypothetical protein
VTFIGTDPGLASCGLAVAEISAAGQHFTDVRAPLRPEHIGGRR